MTSCSVKRPLLGGLALALVASSLSGCAWFRGKDDAYLASRESRPLEVPPDLVLPASSAALQIPAAPASASIPGETPPAAFGPADGFDVEDTAENAFRRVGLALARIEGVASAPVAALNSHEVTFRGETFLIRLVPQDGRVRVDAISAEGTPLRGGAAGELLAQLKARVG